MKTALLLSGGIDSLSIAWWKRPSVAITVDYGQRAAAAEIKSSEAICHSLDITHQVVSVDCSRLGSGDMAGVSPVICAPKSDWWPYRNQLIITLAAMSLIDTDIETLLIGTVRSDQTHKDGTLQFVSFMNALLSYQERGIRVMAPAIDMTTEELVQSANVPINLLAYAHSCHKASLPCGACRGCNKYNQVMWELGYGNKPL